MANIPFDGNRLSLLSTKIGRNKPQRYVNFGANNFSTIYSTQVRVFNREVFVLIYGVDATDSKQYIRLFGCNPMTQYNRMIWSVEYNSTNYGYPQDFVIDNINKMYISMYNKNFIRVIDLDTLELTVWNFPSSQMPICYGKMEWIDSDHFIILTNSKNMLIFDVTTYTIETVPMTGGQSNGDDYCVGKRYVFTTRTKYDVVNKVATSYSLPNNSTPYSVYYDNGKYYFAITNKLYYYDENTDTWSAPYSVGWTNPIELKVFENFCYVVNSNTTRAYLYDINAQQIYSFNLNWTVPYRSSNQMTRGVMFRGCWMIARNTLCYITYDNLLKYNAGPILGQRRIYYNAATAKDFTYDDRFVDFRTSYVTVTDGLISYPDEKRGSVIETIDANRRIYAISVSKDDYKTFKSLILK